MYTTIQILFFLAEKLGAKPVDLNHYMIRPVKYKGRYINIIIDRPTGIGMIGTELELK